MLPFYKSLCKHIRKILKKFRWFILVVCTGSLAVTDENANVNKDQNRLSLILIITANPVKMLLRFLSILILHTYMKFEKQIPTYMYYCMYWQYFD